jgi:polyisoprenoid-binding protein YceI
MPLTEAAVARYALDPALSRLQVRAFSTGLLAGLGHNPNFSARDLAGEILVPPAGPAGGSLELRVKTQSLSASNDIKDKDRREIERIMHSEVLESASFPEIVFRSTAVSAEKTGEGQYRLTLDGDLSMRGVTVGQQIVAYFSLAEEQARAWGDFSLLQTNFGIRLISFAGGALKLKDELKLSFDLVGRRERG